MCEKKKSPFAIYQNALLINLNALNCAHCEAITDFDFRTIAKINKAGLMMRDLP